MSPLAQAVQQALDSVKDPELDRSLAELGFARAALDDEGDVTVEVRLPTFWCAPNFAYLMVQDARDAVAAVPGVRSVSVKLLDHFSGEEVTRGVAAGRSFDEAFPSLSDGEGLEALRRLFKVKAFTARQERVLRRLLVEGRSASEIAGMRLGEVDLGDEDGWEYLEKRHQLGISVEPGEPIAQPLRQTTVVGDHGLHREGQLVLLDREEGDLTPGRPLTLRYRRRVGR